MTSLTLPASIHPDVLIAGGQTYVASPEPRGLMIYLVNPFGDMVTPIWILPHGDWPRLFSREGVVWCAFKTSDDNCLTVANITTTSLTRTGIPAYWNSPICWRNDGLLCVQATNLPIDVWSGMWPELPKPPAIRQGVGTGLAQWMGSTLLTWDELNAENIGIQSQQVVIFGSDRTDSVGQWPQGGILVALGEVEGVLQPFTSTNDPRPALAADGSLSVVYWQQDSHGSTGTVLLQGVTAADLIVNPQPPIRPVSDVVPLPSVSVPASYVFPQE